jgi:hypothetical protein
MDENEVVETGRLGQIAKTARDVGTIAGAGIPILIVGTIGASVIKDAWKSRKIRKIAKLQKQLDEAKAKLEQMEKEG